jgi:ankyrin repeat protein
LLERGARIDARTVADFTPLHAAARDGQVDVVGLLLERGADADADAAGRTPMTLAESGSHVRVIHMLREVERKAAGREAIASAPRAAPQRPGGRRPGPPR